MRASDFAPGDRIRLISMEDDLCKEIPLGITGTVTSVAPEPINVVNVDWDGDFHLNPCLDVDVIDRLEGWE